MTTTRLILAMLSIASATPALAHTGLHEVGGIASGFTHPFGGLDHVLAMVSVGLFAAMLGGRAVWAVPASFILMMLMGGVLGMTGIVIPNFETGVAASVIVLGAVIAWGRSWPLIAAMMLVGVFAVFHGYAHGSEMPAGSEAFSYCVGFALGSLILHISGLAAGFSLLLQVRLARLSGAAITGLGLWVALS
ncbi:HupE/UreJ family protein [Microvirga sp. 2YAF29]|uniref:HupE/UreJ family protein n=1 Tax=Microvirga sp. 2YAF29 TaxID=3233031 RepID=UPI003F97D197